MAEVMSYPFRLRPNGTVATVTQGSDTYKAELIAVLSLTRRGERTLMPGFGMSDPLMVGFSSTELAAQVAKYGPPVQIVDIKQTYIADGSLTAVIEFA